MSIEVGHTGSHFSTATLVNASKAKQWRQFDHDRNLYDNTIDQNFLTLFQAFPDWSWHNAGVGQFNCSGLISVYRIRSDRCNRLWVLDSGVMDSLDNFMRVCPPKLIIFDMRTKEALRVIRFPDELLRPNSLFTNLIIDETGSSGQCDDAFAYITDTAAPGMLKARSALNYIILLRNL